MPSEGDALTPQQVATLRKWIDQGAVWPEGFSFADARKAPLAPRRPDLPEAAPGSDSTHPIDRLLHPYFKQHGVTVSGPVSDRVFARRVYLDLVGLLPPTDGLAAFEKDTRSDKRARLVDDLLTDNRAYADHWLTFWNDALRNAYRGTGFIDSGRKQITGWLYESLYQNKPYNEFVHELVSPPPGSGAEGFTYGIKWRGTVNDSQRREMQAAQTVAHQPAAAVVGAAQEDPHRRLYAGGCNIEHHIGAVVGVGQVVDGDDLQIVAPIEDAEDVAADAAEAVDRDADSHGGVVGMG